MVSKSTSVIFLLLVQLAVGMQLTTNRFPNPLGPNSAERIPSEILQSKHKDQILSFRDRFRQNNIKDRPAFQLKSARRSRIAVKASSVEIDSILVFSQKDTILQIAKREERVEYNTIKIFKRGVYIDSLRDTYRWETDMKGNIVFCSFLEEEWNGERWAPNYRNTEHQTFDQESNFRRSVFEIYENGEWITLITNGSLFLCDRYGYNISWITFDLNSENNWSIRYDTSFYQRRYSADSVSCDAAWDSTLTFLIPNIDQPINSKKDLLDRIAQGNRILSSRAVITRASDGSSWSEQREDLIDGVWKFRSIWSIKDSTDDIYISDVKYCQDSNLVSFRTICESGPYNRRYTKAQLLNGSWVFQTRQTLYNYFDTIVYMIDTLEIIEQWQDGHWKKSSINRTQLDDQHRVVKMSRVSWQDSAWIPSDGGMFFFSADRQLGYWFYGNTLTIHRSIDNSTGMTEIRTQIPQGFELRQNYPNPFNPSTKIGFTLHVSGYTTLTIYDALGREVSTLLKENLESGVYHERIFDASQFSSGIYFAKLTSGGVSRMKKMMMVK